MNVDLVNTLISILLLKCSAVLESRDAAPLVKVVRSPDTLVVISVERDYASCA